MAKEVRKALDQLESHSASCNGPPKYDQGMASDGSVHPARPKPFACDSPATQLHNIHNEAGRPCATLKLYNNCHNTGLQDTAEMIATALQTEAGSAMVWIYADPLSPFPAVTLGEWVLCRMTSAKRKSTDCQAAYVSVTIPGPWMDRSHLHPDIQMAGTKH